MKHSFFPIPEPHAALKMVNSKFRVLLDRLMIFSAIGLCLFSLGFLSGCNSFPKPNSKKDTLLIIPVIVLDMNFSSSYKANFSYQINLENIETRAVKSVFIRSNDASDYYYLPGFPKGKYLIKEYISLGLVNPKVRPLDIQQYLTIEPGKLSVFPVKVVILIKESKDPLFSGTVYIDFKNIDVDQQDRIFVYLSRQDNFKLWHH